MNQAQTTNFSFLLNENEILTIVKAGAKEHLHEKYSHQLCMFIHRSDGTEEQTFRNYPPLIWTITPEDATFERMKEICAANIARVKELQKEYQAKKDAEILDKQDKRDAKEQILIAEAFRMPEGYFAVTITALVSNSRGSDRWQDFSYKVFAKNGYDAYNKAIETFNSKYPKNVCFVYEFGEFSSAYIEYVGQWSEGATLEYGSVVE